MNSIPSISVLIPVYNVARYLPACIESLVAQTKKDIELIFVDDTSTDGSLSILRTYEKKYPKLIKVIALTEKQNLGGARNAAFQEAQAEYIGFCDSDDIAHPRLFEKLYKKAKETDADWTVAQYASFPQDCLAKDIKQLDLKPWIKWSDKLLQWDNKPLTKEGITDVIALEKGGLPVSLLKKSLIETHNLKWPQFRYEDNYFVSLYSAYVQRIAFVPEILYYYRQRNDSTIHLKNAFYQIEDRIRIEHLLLQEVKKRNIFDTYYAAWEFQYIYRYASITTSIALTLFDRIPYKSIRGICIDLNKNFPNWEKNKYWTNTRSLMERITVWLTITTPRIANTLIKLKHLMQKKK